MSTPGTNYQPADDDTQYHEEWLSAYLDDELSAEQRQIVEDRLQRDSAAQQLLAELQSVRNLVGGLPVWQGKPFAFDASSPARGGATGAGAAPAPARRAPPPTCSRRRGLDCGPGLSHWH